MCGYVALEVWLGSQLSLWRSDLAKPTLIWLTVSALVMLVSFDKASKEPRFYRRAVIEAFGIAAFVGFFMNVSPMSLLAEILLQPTRRDAGYGFCLYGPRRSVSKCEEIR